MLRHLGLKSRIIEFLRSKPADEAYFWSDSQNCACGQFIAQNNDSVSAFGGWDIPEIIELNHLARQGGWTFSELRKRVEAVWPLHV